LSKCSDLLLEFGGHKYAAGMKIEPENVERFRERFEEVVREMVPEDGFTPVMTLDASAELTDLGFKDVVKFQDLSPFGAGNPEPVVLLRNVEPLEPRIVGGDHLSLTIRQKDQTVGAIAFRQAHEMENLTNDMELAVIPEIHTWQGVSRVKLRVKGMRPAE
jgi:single-stranded-DNA-specific exonuclease